MDYFQDRKLWILTRSTQGNYFLPFPSDSRGYDSAKQEDRDLWRSRGIKIVFPDLFLLSFFFPLFLAKERNTRPPLSLSLSIALGYIHIYNSFCLISDYFDLLWGGLIRRTSRLIKGPCFIDPRGEEPRFVVQGNFEKGGGREGQVSSSFSF